MAGTKTAGRTSRQSNRGIDLVKGINPRSPVTGKMEHRPGEQIRCANSVVEGPYSGSHPAWVVLVENDRGLFLALSAKSAGIKHCSRFEPHFANLLFFLIPLLHFLI